jgi:hypothetical protein
MGDRNGEVFSVQFSVFSKKPESVFPFTENGKLNTEN